MCSLDAGTHDVKCVGSAKTGKCRFINLANNIDSFCRRGPVSAMTKIPCRQRLFVGAAMFVRTLLADGAETL